MERYPREGSVWACFAQIFLPRDRTKVKLSLRYEPTPPAGYVVIWRTFWAWDCTHCFSILSSHLSNFYSVYCKMMAQSEVFILNTIFHIYCQYYFFLKKKKNCDLRILLEEISDNHLCHISWVYTGQAKCESTVWKLGMLSQLECHSMLEIQVMWNGGGESSCDVDQKVSSAGLLQQQPRNGDGVSIFAFTVSSRQMIPCTVNFSPLDRVIIFPILAIQKMVLDFQCWESSFSQAYLPPSAFFYMLMCQLFKTHPWKSSSVLCPWL